MAYYTKVDNYQFRRSNKLNFEQYPNLHQAQIHSHVWTAAIYKGKIPEVKKHMMKLGWNKSDFGYEEVRK